MRPPEPSGTVESSAALLQAAFRYAYSLTANESDAEDLVQSAWLKVREHYGRSIDRRLLFRSLRNLFLDGYRHARRFPIDSYESTIVESNAPEHHEHATSENSCHYEPALARELARLRDVEREALFLSVIEGYTAAEIAHMTDSTRGNVLSLVHRARTRLKSWLAEPDGETAERGPHLVKPKRKKST